MQPLHLQLLIVGGVLVLFLHRTLNRCRERKADRAIGERHGCLPAPMIQNLRPLGIDHLQNIFRADSESRLMEYFLFHFRQTGNTVEEIFLGVPSFATVDPANLEAMLSTNFQDWSMGARRKVTFPLFGDGIFTQDGEAWKHSRDLLRPQFHFKQYADLEIFNQAVDNLIDNIPVEGGTVDLQPLFFRLTLDVTTAFLFGESVQSLRTRESTGEQTFVGAFNTAQDYVAKRFRIQELYWLIGGRKFNKACRVVHDFADQVITRNLLPESGGEEHKRYIFLNTLSKRTADKTALRSQIINILIAGRDTTACLLSWTFFLLVRYPHVLERLRAEIAASCDSSTELKRDHLRSLKYLQNVIKETLRLYPPVPVNSRTALRTTILPTGGGPDRKSPILIPKGSCVAYSVYTMHRRPDLYGMDAEIFRPERWDEALPLNHSETDSKWGYLPFNGGPRICLGMDFAIMEAGYTIVRIIQRFPVIKLPEGSIVELTGVEKQRMTLVMSIAEGCKVELR